MIRKATPADNEQLIQLTARNPMAGAISLRIDRRPDFFALSELRGDTTTFVVEAGGRIAGCFSASKTVVFINGKPTEIYYLSDLKIDTPYRGSSHLYQLVKRMRIFLQEEKAGLVVCVVAKGNKWVEPLLEGRLGFPVFHPIGCFKVLQLLPMAKFHSRENLKVKAVQPHPELIDKLKQFNQSYQLGKALPSVPENSLFFAAYRGTEMVAALSVVDTFPYKQNIVIGASPLLRTLIKVSKLAAQILSTPSLPDIGEPLKMVYVNNFFYLKGETKAFFTLVGRARQEAFMHAAHFLSIGLHERDTLLESFRPYWKKIVFSSNGYISSLKKGGETVESIQQGIPYEDFSLV